MAGVLWPFAALLWGQCHYEIGPGTQNANELRQSGFSAEREIADVALRSRLAANEDSAVGDKADLVLGRDGEEVASPIPIVKVKCPLVPVSGPSARSRKSLARREQARN